MTPAQLARKSAALEAIRSEWERHLQSGVAERLLDAHAHALAALARQPPGTAAGIALLHSTGLAAAESRLDGLSAWLASAPLTGAVREAREAFYREAAHLWPPLIPGDLRAPADPSAERPRIDAVKAALVHGRDLRADLRSETDRARADLRAAAVASLRRTGLGHPLDGWLDRWHARLRSAVSTALNDSVEYADRTAGADLIHPEFIDTSPPDD